MRFTEETDLGDRMCTTYLHYSDLLHTPFACDTIVIPDLIDTNNLTQHSRPVQKRENIRTDYKTSSLACEQVLNTYSPWKNALLRYSKYAGAQSRNICSSVLDIYLITNRSSDVRAKLAPLFPPLAAQA